MPPRGKDGAFFCANDTSAHDGIVLEMWPGGWNQSLDQFFIMEYGYGVEPSRSYDLTLSSISLFAFHVTV